LRNEAIFINGVYEGVLEEILNIQAELPWHVMYLQPHSSSPIVHLRDDLPSPEDPVHLYLSITTDLPTVKYVAEVVGWDDKTEIPPEKSNVINRVIWTLQPSETGLYDASAVKGKASVNLLYVWRMRKLARPFSVSRLVKTSNDEAVSPERTRAGGWVYVRNQFVGS
jgi:hypothetical protein